MTDETPKRNRGCLFYGCLVSSILALVVLAAGLLGLSYAKRMLTHFTDTQPAVLPTVQMPADQVEQVRQRYSEFKQAISQRRATQPLALTGDEINVLLANNPELASIKNKLYVSIEGDRLKGQVSMPMAEMGLPLFRNRFLNGTATFSVSLQNGLLRVTAQDVTVKGKPLPGVYLDRIRQQNLAQAAQEEPRNSIVLEQLKDIQVKDGKLIITPKLEP